MKTSTKIGLATAIFVIVFFPIFFSTVSYVTGNWQYFWYSLVPTIFAGSFGLIASIIQAKKDIVLKG